MNGDNREILGKLSFFVDELKEKLGIECKVSVKIKNYKRKIASFSFSTYTISINRNFLEVLDDEEIKYILAHELLHIKYGYFHTREFEKELERLFKKDISGRIIRKYEGFKRDR